MRCDDGVASPAIIVRMRLGRVGEDFEFLQNVLGHRFQSMFYFCSFLQRKG
jgi:hypothetical protein